jgi:hypothetical protein
MMNVLLARRQYETDVRKGDPASAFHIARLGLQNEFLGSTHCILVDVVSG